MAKTPKAAALAVLFTLSLWAGGCTGSASLDWGPKGTRYQRIIQPHSGYQPHAWEQTQP